MKVLIGLIEVAGFGASLAEGLRNGGIRTDNVDLGASPFRYDQRTSVPEGPEGITPVPGPMSQRPVWLALAERFARYVREPAFIPRLLMRCRVLWLVRAMVLAVAVCRYNVFIFLYGDSFLPRQFDLPLLRALRKKCVFVFLGSDSRPVVLNGALYPYFVADDGTLDTAALQAMQSKINAVLIKTARYADIIVNSPLCAQAQRKWCANWFHLGFPVPVGDEAAPMPAHGGGLRILHAPSNSQYKGTHEIRRVIAALQKRGINIIYEEISGRPNLEVLAAIRRCHVLVDELYSDTGLGGLGCEAASLGRLVVVGGFGWEQVDHWSPDGIRFPSLRIDPSQLEETLLRLASCPGEIDRRGEEHFQFMRDVWAADRVAGRLQNWIERGVPPASRFEPRESTALSGCGAPAEQIREVLCRAMKLLTPEQLGLGGSNEGVRMLCADLEDEAKHGCHESNGRC